MCFKRCMSEWYLRRRSDPLNVEPTNLFAESGCEPDLTFASAWNSHCKGHMTLIYGKRDAVLVGTFLTVDQNDVLADWIKGSGKNLTTIYITHGHGDHWFGIGALLERFPGARAVASRAVVNMMKEQSPEVLKSWWHARLPGQIPERVVIAEELVGNVIKLEGHDLVVVGVGHTDTHDTTVLHVPAIGLVVAGDAVQWRSSITGRDKSGEATRVDRRAR
jgi:glyoxylase-like metal-dependent hydrolase (beta-lactamase superfamily II)